jgi:type I restriction enzyme S subunit
MKGWETKTLGEVCVVDKHQGIYKGLPYVGLEHIESRTGRFVGSTEPLAVKSSTFKFSPEHVLYGRLRPYLSKVMLPDFTGHCSTEIFPIKPHPELTREFLQYWFLRDATVEQIDATSTGARMPRADMNAVLDFEFPLPPLPEQRRIVGILDEAFEGIAAARANAEKNLQNARALFESHLQSVFSQRGEGWVDAKLGDVCDRITDGTHVTPRYTPSGVPFLSVKNLTHGFIDFSNTRYISVEEHRFLTRRCKPVRDDILYTKVGTTGIAQVVDVDDEFSIFVSVALLKPKHEVVFNHYLEHFLNAPFAREQAEKRTRGMANRNLVITDIKEIDIHYPAALDKQRAIVADLDALSAENQRLASIYERKLAALEALKKSLLDQAFSGKLNRGLHG